MNPYKDPEAPTTLGSNRGRGTRGNAGVPGTRSGRQIETEETMTKFQQGEQVRWDRADNLSGAFTFPPAELSGTIGTIEFVMVEGKDFDAEVGQMYTVIFPGQIIHAFEDELSEPGQDGARRGSTARGGGNVTARGDGAGRR